jgi:thymidylate kinase
MGFIKGNKRFNSPVVVFFGVDGVGKTTQANLLVAYYKEKTNRVQKCWIRARHSVAFFVSKILLTLGYSKTILNGDNVVLDSRHLPFKTFWGFLEFFSVVPLILTRMVIPSFLGSVVISERYVIDTIVFNSFFIGHEFIVYNKLLLKMMPPNAILIHLDATESDIINRKNEDWPIDFIRYQLNSYRYFAEYLGATVINTSETSISETFSIIVDVCQNQNR